MEPSQKIVIKKYRFIHIFNCISCDINDFDKLSFYIYSHRYVTAENTILGCLSVIASKNFLVDQEFTLPETRGRVTKS